MDSVNENGDRRMSTSSVSSLNSPESNSSINSTTALILISDEEARTPTSDTVYPPFDFSDEDLDDEDFGDQAQSDRLRSSAVPALSPNVVLLYLASPYLKLGALLVFGEHLPLKFGLPALFFFSALAAFTRQIWYMLARYVRKADLEEIVLDALARGRGKEKRRQVLRTGVRLGTGVMKVLLASVYLRESVEIVLPLLPDALVVSPRVIVTLLLGIIMLPLYWARTLAYKRIIYATSTSLGAYVLWLALLIYSHAKGTQISGGGLRMGSLWQGITTMAFAFTSTLTLPLYASLKGTEQPVTTSTKKSPSFKILSILSVILAVVLVLPLVIISSASDLKASRFPPTYLMAFLRVAILVLTIPTVLITCPAVPIPVAVRRSTNLPLSKMLLFSIMFFLSFVPDRISSILDDILLVMALSGTYAFPALIHIITHFFKSPLSIIIPQTPSFRHAQQLPSEGSVSSTDELLQRKERTLQMRRLWRRIVWDIGVWVLLVPVSGGGLVWAGGKIAGVW